MFVSRPADREETPRACFFLSKLKHCSPAGMVVVCRIYV